MKPKDSSLFFQTIYMHNIHKNCSTSWQLRNEIIVYMSIKWYEMLTYMQYGNTARNSD